jgi:hypothetical protein
MKALSNLWMIRRGVAAFAVLLIGAACQSSAEPPDPTQGIVAEVGKQFELRMAQTATVEALRLKLVAVTEDSRCPIDAVCIWQGNAKVEIDATVGIDGPTYRLALNTGVQPMEVAVSGFTVKLVNVQPAARSSVTIPQSAYSAVLLVTR